MDEQKPKRKYQYLSTVGTSLGGFVSGGAVGWSSSSYIVFTDHYKHLEDDDIRYLDSALKLGAAVAVATFGLTISYVGSRTAMAATSIPCAAGWTLLAICRSMENLCLGRFIVGFCLGAVCVAAPIYIGHISDKYIRGMLCELFSFSMTFGILVVYCLGETKNIFAITVPFCICPFVLFFMLLYLPESPVDLYHRGKIEKAKRSLHIFRGKDYDVEPELKVIEENSIKMKDNFWINLLRYSSIKAGIILIVMHCIQQLSGVYIIIMHAYWLCEVTNVFENPNTGAIVLGVVQLVFSSISTAVVDRIGRRPLWIISLAAMALGYVIIALHFQLVKVEKVHSLQPLIGMAVVLASFCLGVGPLPFVMIAELLPEEVKGCIGSIAMTCNWLIGFVVIISFHPIIELEGETYMFYTFALVCFVGIIFVAVFVIETKHKSLDQIQKELEGVRENT